MARAADYGACVREMEVRERVRVSEEGREGGGGKEKRAAEHIWQARARTNTLARLN
jgi:hypothetical protein